MREADLHWTVGLLEGEGCFSPHFYKRAGGERAYYCCVEVRSIDLEVLERLQALWGGKIYPVKKTRAHHKQAYTWTCYGAAGVAVINAVYPYLSSRRTDQIEAAYELIQSTRLTPADRVRRRVLQSYRRPITRPQRS